MKATHRPIPPRDDLLALFDAAQENALALITDAEILAEADRFPRAYALATLALEELGKADLCLVAMTWPEMPSEEFWEIFKDHEVKLARAHFKDSFRQPEPYGTMAKQRRKGKKFSRSRHSQKMRGLYVDYENGRISNPKKITETMARAQIKTVGESVIFAHVLHWSGESLTDRLEKIRVQREFFNARDEGYVESLAEALRQSILGGSKERLNELLRQGGFPDTVEDVIANPGDGPNM